MSAAKTLAAALDVQSDRRGGGVKYLTAKHAARELLRQDQAIAELANRLQWYVDNDTTGNAGKRNAIGVLRKHTQNP